MDCSTCKNNRKVEPVPYIVHESAMARQERTIKRLWVIILLALLLLVGTNVGWLIYESQYEVYETWQDVTQEATGDGVNRFIGGDYYGETED